MAPKLQDTNLPSSPSTRTESEMRSDHSSPPLPLVLAARNAFISSVKVLQDSIPQQAGTINFDVLYHFVAAYQLLDPTLSHPSVAESASALAGLPSPPSFIPLLAPYLKTRSSSKKQSEHRSPKQTTNGPQHSDSTISSGSTNQHAHAGDVSKERSTSNAFWYSTDEMPEDELVGDADLGPRERGETRGTLYKYSFYWGNDRCLFCVSMGIEACKTEYGVSPCKLCKQNNIICMTPFDGEKKYIEPFVLSHLPTFLAPGGTGPLARDGEIWLIPILEQEAYFRREYFRHEPMSMLSAHLHRRQAPPPRPRDDDDYEEEEEEEEEEDDDSSADEVEQQRIIRWVKNLRKVSTFRDAKRLLQVVWGADVRGIQYRYRNKRCMRCKQRGNLNCAVRPGVASCAWCKLKKKGCIRPPTANVSRRE